MGHRPIRQERHSDTQCANDDTEYPITAFLRTSFTSAFRRILGGLRPSNASLGFEFACHLYSPMMAMVFLKMSVLS